MKEFPVLSLVEHMPNGFAHCRMVMDAGEPVDFQYLLVNPAFETLTGLKDVAGRWVTEVIPGIREMDDPLFQAYGRVVRTGTPERFEIWVDALAQWFDVSVFRPRPGEFVAIFEVITQRKLTEAALKESEDRYRRMFEDSLAAKWVVDPDDGRILDVNEAACKFYGWPREAFIGKALAEINLTLKTGLREAMRRIAAREGDHFEFRHRLADGSVRDVEVFATAIPRGGKTVLASIIHDVTEKKRVQQQMRALEGRLAHLQRLESIETIASSLAHDMNNVLATCLAVSEMMAMEEGEPSSDRPFASILERATFRGRDLVRALQAFCRKTLVNPELLDLGALVRKEATRLQGLHSQGVTVAVDLPETLPPIRGEVEGLSTVLSQLSANALDAMPKGGTLLLSAKPLGESYVEIQVKDDGQGMSHEVLSRSLDPFFTTKKMGKGMGLGLSQVYGTIKAHGGSVEIQSSPGEGTTVVLALPVAGDGQTSAPDRPLTGERPEPRRILLVDDDELIRSTFPALIKRLGHAVTTAGGGREALEQLRAGLEADLVILDLNMPDLDGAQTLQAIRKDWPDLQVLIATGFADERIPPLLGRYQHLGLLTKPFTLVDLTMALRGIG